jgi:L-lactate dehydrogenase complex protein LldG
MSARDVVLGRVRAALGPDPAVPAIPRGYVGAGGSAPAGDPGVIARFAERVADYRATVHHCAPDGLGALLQRLIGDELVVATPALAPLLQGQATLDDPPLSTVHLDACAAVLTGCAASIADTGTIVLDGGPDSGRRVMSLIPDHHVCVVRGDQIVATVPDAVAALEPAVRGGLPLTLVSGPSATSDIELERVEGVHGPRRLDVVIVS